MATSLVGLIAFTGPVAAADEGTPAEAEALVKKAVAYIKASGTDKAHAEFTSGNAFKDRDLYVFVVDFSGKALAHGANAKLVRKDLMGLKDPDGKPVIKLTIDFAQRQGHGWTETVKFRTTDKIQLRRSYVERVGETVVGSGVCED